MDEKTVINGKSAKQRWLVPQNDINGGTRYVRCPIGNFLEFVPWKNFLNADIKRSHDYHCINTAHLKENNIQKFSMKTPQIISRGIARLFENKWEDGVPSSQ